MSPIEWLGALMVAVSVTSVRMMIERWWGHDAALLAMALFNAVAAALGLLVALAAALRAEWVEAVIWAALSGILAWRAWTDWNSRNRRRRASRVSSRVVDLGHKLAVEKA